jgi:hypothetical protein
MKMANGWLKLAEVKERVEQIRKLALEVKHSICCYANSLEQDTWMCDCKYNQLMRKEVPTLGFSGAAGIGGENTGCAELHGVISYCDQLLEGVKHAELLLQRTTA